MVISQSKITIRAKQTVFRRYTFTLQTIEQLLMRFSFAMLITATFNVVKGKKLIAIFSTAGTFIAIHLKYLSADSITTCFMPMIVSFRMGQPKFLNSFSVLFRMISPIISFLLTKSFKIFLAPLSSFLITAGTAIITKTIGLPLTFTKGINREVLLT